MTAFWQTVVQWQWRQPEWLWLLLVPVLLSVWRLWRAYRQPAQFAEVALWPWVRADWMTTASEHSAQRFFERIKQGGLKGLRLLTSRKLILTLAWISWVIALAGPRTWLSETQQSQRQGADILVVMDVSRSMLAKDIAPNRFAFAKGVVDALNHQLQPNDRIGLMAFQAYPHLVSPLSGDHALFNHYLSLTHVDMMPTRGSRVEKALVSAHHYLDQTAQQPGLVIVLTNGRPDFWKLQPPPAGFEALKQSPHQSVIVGIGTSQAVTLPVKDPESGQVQPLRANGLLVKSRLEKGFLKQLTSQIHGTYLTAENSASVLKQLETLISKRAGTHTQTTQQGYWQDQAYPFIVAGTLLLFWAFYPIRLWRQREEKHG